MDESWYSSAKSRRSSSAPIQTRSGLRCVEWDELPVRHRNAFRLLFLADGGRVFHFFEVVQKAGRWSVSSTDRVVVVSHCALYVFLPNSDVRRCVPVVDVDELLVSSPDEGGEIWVGVRVTKQYDLIFHLKSRERCKELEHVLCTLHKQLSPIRDGNARTLPVHHVQKPDHPRNHLFLRSSGHRLTKQMLMPLVLKKQLAKRRRPVPASANDPAARFLRWSVRPFPESMNPFRLTLCQPVAGVSLISRVVQTPQGEKCELRAAERDKLAGAGFQGFAHWLKGTPRSTLTLGPDARSMLLAPDGACSVVWVSPLLAGAQGLPDALTRTLQWSVCMFLVSGGAVLLCAASQKCGGQKQQQKERKKNVAEEREFHFF
eukprot:TRINITY_DN4758_c0_g2_i2.p1 TRINITY_DN4758_c0_g2~~TRINITY_DN4758_c0_g2_i2.p1  ORF type:complete len:391 (+),score=23.03 TRINITY_DN4758_c0_g2_i2:54-1175(+)